MNLLLILLLITTCIIVYTTFYEAYTPGEVIVSVVALFSLTIFLWFFIVFIGGAIIGKGEFKLVKKYDIVEVNKINDKVCVKYLDDVELKTKVMCSCKTKHNSHSQVLKYTVPYRDSYYFPVYANTGSDKYEIK